ncbi:putative Pollen Ole e 1 allergen and extensin family protein [Cocos nucifera]|uniref:Putative Pollen Ole e 1 allergen and extensin family protein n=1 Tax=Cocos nucifera TaxID=13894 RepID=A0A8K0IWS4_COCNU|nr:putative Pollen Ole e 1 allergen and extensin family protein [Cocos nucifera]
MSVILLLLQDIRSLTKKGVVVAVKCNHEKKLLPALTNNKGYFEVEIPTKSSPPSSSPPHCLVRLLGGPEQLCSFNKSMTSKIVKAQGLKESYALATPLTFFRSCPSHADQNWRPDETSDAGAPRVPNAGPPRPDGLPLPKDWILPPLIYVFPFIPIIGIP